MASRGGTNQTYPIKFESNAKEIGEQGATALEALRAKVQQSQEAVKGYDATLRKLKGSSDEVKAAKLELKNKIDAERTAITDATLKLLKAGTSYEKLADAHKKFSDEVKKGSAEKLKSQNDALGKTLERIGGPAADLKGKIGGLSDALEAGATAEGAVAIGAAAAAAGLAILAAGVVFLTAKFGEYVITSGDALRNQQLQREAFVGNAEDAKRLGNQVEELSKKTRLSREEISKMGADLSLAGFGGQRLVDALNAQANAQAALGGDAGNKVKELTTRGKYTGAAGLSPTELRDASVGFQFKDVRDALAKNLKVPLEEAGQALIENRVKADDFAKAIRDVTATKFGDVNAKQLLSLDTLALKGKEALQALTKDVNLEPLLNALKDLFGLLDTSTEAGTDIKLLVDQLGGGLVDGVTGSEPIVKGFLEGLINFALDLDIEYLKLKLQFVETFDALDIDTSKFDGLKFGSDLAKEMTGTFRIMLDVLKGIASAGEAAGAGIAKAVDSYEKLKANPNPIKSAIGGGGGVAGQALAALLPGFAEGLDRVPYDNFPARLHKDERVLTRAEAEAYNALIRNAGAGSSSSSAPASSGGDRYEINVPIVIQGNASHDTIGELETRVRAVLVKIVEDINRSRGFTAATVGGRSP